MIEEIRKNSKLVKLLNGFYLSLSFVLVMFILKMFNVTGENESLKKILEIGTAILGSISFQLIFICVISYLGNFKTVLNVNWFGKVAVLNIIFSLIFEVSKAMVQRVSINTTNLIGVTLGIIIAAIYLFLVDNEESK